jgi:hypothetical protein
LWYYTSISYNDALVKLVKLSNYCNQTSVSVSIGNKPTSCHDDWHGFATGVSDTTSQEQSYHKTTNL